VTPDFPSMGSPVPIEWSDSALPKWSRAVVHFHHADERTVSTFAAEVEPFLCTTWKWVVYRNGLGQARGTVASRQAGKDAAEEFIRETIMKDLDDGPGPG
jgi:hypothetical protein